MDINEAVNEAEKFKRFVKAFEKLQETAAELRGAEQVVAERKAAAAILDGQLAAKREELAQAGTELAEHNEALKEVRGIAASIIAGAKSEAASIKAQASEEKAALDALVADLQRTERGHRATLSALEGELAAAKATIAKADAAKAALAALS